nr:immunoglobulin heavy chain junction region [Mus musculus]
CARELGPGSYFDFW